MSCIRWWFNSCVLICSVLSTAILIPTAAAEPVLYIAHGGGNSMNTAGGEIGTLSLSSGIYTSLGAPVPGQSLSGLAFDGSKLFAANGTSTSSNLIEVNPVTGSLVSSVPFSGANFDVNDGDRITDLAFDPTSGTMYLAGRDDVTDDGLYTVNVATGVLSFVGSFASSNINNGFESIAFGPDGTLYRHETNSGVAETVNPLTAATIAPLAGTVAGGALGLVFDIDTGNSLLASECCRGPDRADAERIYRLDLGTGTPSLLIDFDDGRKIQDLEFVNLVPEPSTALLAALALTPLLRRPTRQRRFFD